MQQVTEKEKTVFHTALEKVFKEPVRLLVNDNTHVFFNIYYRKKKWTVRLHWMFLKSEDPAETARHLAQYTFYRTKKSARFIDRYIEERWHWVRHPLPPIHTKGKYFDLQAIFNDLNRKYCDGKVAAKITWGKKKEKNYRGQLQMGSYSTSRNLITIHPRLDQKFVPKIVVEATIYHEMCHAMIPVRRVNGRRSVHPPAFKKLEAKYPRLKEVHAWEEKHFNLLLKRPKRR